MNTFCEIKAHLATSRDGHERNPHRRMRPASNPNVNSFGSLPPINGQGGLKYLCDLVFATYDCKRSANNK